MVRLATQKLRIRNSASSSIGWRARASRSDEEREAGDPGERAAARRAGRPSRGSAARSARRPGRRGPPRRAGCPARSTPWKASGSRLSATARRVSATVKAISGMFSQKIARQESASTSAPPPAGPITTAIPVQAVQVPTAWPRAAPSKVAATKRQRARHEQRPGDPLQGAGADQELDRGRERAEDRGDAEGDQAGDEDPPPPELVAERAADQEQRDQGQHVGLDHPLLAGQPRVEPVGDRRQRHVDHGRVEEDDGRAEDRREQRQTLLPSHPPSVGGPPRPSSLRS